MLTGTTVNEKLPSCSSLCVCVTLFAWWWCLRFNDFAAVCFFRTTESCLARYNLCSYTDALLPAFPTAAFTPLPFSFLCFIASTAFLWCLLPKRIGFTPWAILSRSTNFPTTTTEPSPTTTCAYINWKTKQQRHTRNRTTNHTAAWGNGRAEGKGKLCTPRFVNFCFLPLCVCLSAGGKEKPLHTRITHSTHRNTHTRHFKGTLKAAHFLDSLFHRTWARGTLAIAFVLLSLWK